jgi:hypothetical protein
MMPRNVPEPHDEREELRAVLALFPYCRRCRLPVDEDDAVLLPLIQRVVQTATAPTPNRENPMLRDVLLVAGGFVAGGTCGAFAMAATCVTRKRGKMPAEVTGIVVREFDPTTGWYRDRRIYPVAGGAN